MSRILVRSIANIGKLITNVKNVSLKSSSLTSCNVKCVPSMMQSFGRSYVTKAEQSLAQHLEKEMKKKKGRSERFYEHQNEIEEFIVQKLDGTDVELFRKFNDEKIIIKFNISLKNRKIEYLDYNSDCDDEEDINTIAIQPSFTVEISKDKEKNLVLKLDFMGCGPWCQGYIILSFTISKNGEVDNSTYSIVGKNMDEYVDSYLRMMLAERGVDLLFLKNLQGWATYYNKRLKRKLLGDLNKCIT